MNKYMSALILAGICTAMIGTGAQAASEDDVREVVQSYLDNSGYKYSYDEDSDSYDLEFSLNNSLSSTDVSIFIYDDMVSVTVRSPLKFKEEQFESLAIYTSLVNDEIYYGQFRVSKEYGTVSTRTCNVIETVLPGEEEIATLMEMAVSYMERYGDGIASICVSNTDPYEAFEAVSAD